MAESMTTSPPAANGDTPAPLELPAFVHVGGTPRFRPNELRMLRAQTGQTLETILADPADAMQAMAWIRLRRLGFDVTWEQAGEVEVELGEEAPDPTSGESPTASPRSVDSGA